MCDGSTVQQNVSRADGKPNVLLSVMKTSVSTPDIVREIRDDMLPTSRAAAPGEQSFGAWLVLLLLRPSQGVANTGASNVQGLGELGPEIREL